MVERLRTLHVIRGMREINREEIRELDVISRLRVQQANIFKPEVSTTINNLRFEHIYDL